MSVTISASLLSEAAKYFQQFPEIAKEAARMSLNQVSERQGLAGIRQTMEEQIVFPGDYLKRDDRLGIAKKATNNDLTVIIRARGRATSLARFAPGFTPENSRRKPVTVMVKKGGAKRLGNVFLVRLRSGSDGSMDNIGLATRDPGLISKAYKPVALGNGAFLLYGPSVDQVFKGVADDAIPGLSDAVSKEFLRQFARLSAA